VVDVSIVLDLDFVVGKEGQISSIDETSLVFMADDWDDTTIENFGTKCFRQEHSCMAAMRCHDISHSNS
jgi:hypothetical protein